MNGFTITPDIPFSLQAAGSFGFGPHTGRPEPDDAVMRMAFVTDDLRHQVAVRLRQDPRGDIHAQVHGDARPADADVEAQVRRILSLDQPAARGWPSASATRHRWLQATWDRASRTPGSGGRTVDLLLARREH